MATPLTRKDWLIECGKLAKVYEDAMTNPKHTSSDLVERLRGDWPEILVEKHWMMDSDAIDKQREEAADRIEALEAENERLREALEPFTFREDGDDEAVSIQHPSIIVRCEVTYGDIQLARAALAAMQEAKQ